MTNLCSKGDPNRYGLLGSAFNRLGTVILLLLCLLAPRAAMAQVTPATSGGPIKIIVLGDSLSAGYKLPREAAFTSQLEVALKAKGYDVTVPNTGVSGETTSGGLSRLDWVLGDKPDMMIVELGANDGLRGIDPARTRENLDKILSKLKEKKVPVLLAGMMAPRNLGSEYAKVFDAIYPDLAKKHGVPLYPFFLEGVAMDPKLNQEDGMHPTAEGVAVIVKNIMPSVMAVLDTMKAGAK
ncbi:arylesterase [Niveispirillum lacus]|uniref:Arylesterase n=2 Tax=Niveispirillum lacus TaxID=1981099 RepID=A0A255Z1K4_9PROT|nr:arylesterase [Niveispirillum lacus]